MSEQITEQDRAQIAETVRALMSLSETARQFVLGYAAGVIQNQARSA